MLFQTAPNRAMSLSDTKSKAPTGNSQFQTMVLACRIGRLKRRGRAWAPAGRLQELCLLQQRRALLLIGEGVTAQAWAGRGRLSGSVLRVTAFQVGVIWRPDSQAARRML